MVVSKFGVKEKQLRFLKTRAFCVKTRFQVELNVLNCCLLCRQLSEKRRLFSSLKVPMMLNRSVLKSCRKITLLIYVFYKNTKI